VNLIVGPDLMALIGQALDQAMDIVPDIRRLLFATDSMVALRADCDGQNSFDDCHGTLPDNSLHSMTLSTRSLVSSHRLFI
jgi:hypothetical protein